jgi:hypothetical protein
MNAGVADIWPALGSVETLRCPWMKAWSREAGRFPTPLSQTLRLIKSESLQSEPSDVMAWCATQYLFVECKEVDEGFTDAECAFMWGAVEKAGVEASRFAVLRADYGFPER